MQGSALEWAGEAAADRGYTKSWLEIANMMTINPEP